MQPRANRTVICSVVFMDIVEYSRKPVAEQIRLKERLNELLSIALADVAANDRIILDTGDGAAISFLGDPEDALFVGMSLREALVAPPPPDKPELPLRIGVNLGPVKLITDLNGRPNIIGDGINVAQRVMSFAAPGQILVSRSYYEVVSRMSDDYVKLFSYQGARTDKHVREHEVYAVSGGQAGLQRVSASVHQRAGNGRTLAPAVVIDRLSETATLVQDNLRRKPRLSTALAVSLILFTALLVRLTLISAPESAVAETRIAESRSAATPSRKPASAPAAGVVEPAPSLTNDSKGASSKSASLDRPPVAQSAPKAPVERRDTAKAEPAATPPSVERSLEPGEPAKLRFAIAPWGEVYVDGIKAGVAPPLRELPLEPGRHTIEVRNADFPVHIQIVTVKAGEQIRIRHKFR